MENRKHKRYGVLVSKVLEPEAYVLKKGIIASMNPQFVQCSYEQKRLL